MKLKQLLTTIFILTISFSVKAQDGQPFKSIGKKVKVLTLSKGKYVEFFDYDTVQRIGTVLYNIRTKKIVRLLNADSVYKKASNNTSASRWYSPDPLADKFASLSPYNFVENNPINKIDPDGMEGKDWFKDNKGIMQFDPTVKKQSDVGDKGTYVGPTKTETSKRGSKVEYRKDGSILFSNENDAYDRMATIGKTREALAVNLDSKTLYLPDYKNDISTSEDKSLGYLFNGNKIHDPITGKELSFSASIHTHLSFFNGKPWGEDNASFSDIYKFSKETPNVPFLTIGRTNINGYFGSWKPSSDGLYHYSDTKFIQFMQIPQTKLYNGLRNIINQNRSKYGSF
jgi:hypothetical protein